MRFVKPLAISSVLLMAAAANADVTPLLKSDKAGPTILILTDATADRDISMEVTLQQIGSWSLTSGSVMVAPLKEADAAIKATSPAAIAILHNVRSAEETASLETRGIDGTKLLVILNACKDEQGEALTLTDGVKDLPHGDIPAIRVSLVRKSKSGTTPAAEARIFRNAVYTLLANHDMTKSSPWTVMAAKPNTIKVALYAGPGSDASPGPIAYPKIFDSDPGVQFTYLGPAELSRPGALDGFDVMCFCGGGGGAQGKAIGKEGITAVDEFVKKGGGYISSCAGSYLASTSYPWSLNLVNAVTVDTQHWARGTGDVDIELTPEGKKILGDKDGQFLIHYANGPLLGPGKLDGLQPYTPLAIYRGDMAKNVPGGVMPGTPAIIAGECGQGRVLCFSAHPEYTEGLQSFVTRGLRWITRKPVD